MATAETIRSPRVTALVDHGGEGSRPPAHVGARDGGAGWRRDDGLARGHAARGRDRRQASGEVLAADVESLGGESTRTAMMVEHVGIFAKDTIGSPPILRVYLDTNIISAWVKKDIAPEEFEALQLVLLAFHSEKLTLCTSHVAGEELDRLPDEHRRMHRLVYEFIKRVPHVAEYQTHSALMPHEVPGVRHREDPLLIELRGVLRKDDPRHVFQAIKNHVAIFLTVDGGIRHWKAELAKHGLRVLSPSELIREINAGGQP
jgi:predicted nucleic acid-binding protein